MLHGNVTTLFKRISTRQKITLCKNVVYYVRSVVRPNYVPILCLNSKYDMPFESGPVVQSSTPMT